MANPVVVENITLPSLGKVQSREINPNVSLRSMTTAEEFLTDLYNKWHLLLKIV